MVEKKFFNTDEIHAVMPVEIKIRVYSSLFENQLFDKDGQPVFVFDKGVLNKKNEPYEVFTDDIYIELLGIENEKKAEDFINTHSFFCFSFTHDFGGEFSETTLINKRKYLQFMLRNIKQFKEISAIYKEVTHMLNEPENINAALSAVRLLATDPTSEQRLLLDQLNPSPLKLLHSVEPQIEKLISFIEQQTKTIKIVSFFKPIIEFRCPSLLSAMYQKMLISAFNREEYRQCANKRCTNYFKVGNRTTQKYCEKHLEARRRKQRNYLYGKDYDL